MQIDQPNDLVTADEVGQRLRVRPGTVLAWYREGRIPARKLSHKVLRFSLANVLAALEGQQTDRGQGGGQ
jgi:predicted site-specific integrase-resolvase